MMSVQLLQSRRSSMVCDIVPCMITIVECMEYKFKERLNSIHCITNNIEKFVVDSQSLSVRSKYSRMSLLS